MGGFARVLEYMPKDYPKRGWYEKQMREMAATFASIQDPKDNSLSRSTVTTFAK